MAVTLQGSASGVSTAPTTIVPKPAGATPGCFMLAVVAFQASWSSATNYNGTGGFLQTPSGWIPVRVTDHYPAGGPAGLTLGLYRRFMQIGDIEWQFKVLGRLAPAPLLYVIRAYGGVDQTTPIDVENATINTPAAGTSVAPSLTTTVANTRLVVGFLAPRDAGAGGPPLFSTPASMAAHVLGQTSNNSSPEPGGSLATFDQAIAGTGATGTRTSTLSFGSVETIAFSVALMPDQSEPTAEPAGFDVQVEFGVPSFLQEEPPAPIDELLVARPDDSLVRIVAKLRPFDVGSSAEVPLTVATVGLTTEPGDSPPGEHFREVLVDNVEISRSIFAGGALGGAGSISLGSLTMLNGDGALDGLPDQALEARDAELWVGGAVRRAGVLEELPWSGYLRFLVAKSGPAAGDLGTVGVPLTDRGAIFDRWVQLTRYAGTGGTEGGEDLAGVPKPIVLGTVRNAEPRLLSKVPLVYQGHDGAVGALRSLPAVYDSGIKLPSSLYTVNLSAGTFTLLTNPAGRVTFDAVGPTAAGDRAATFAKWLTSTAGVGPLTFPNDFAADYYLAFEASQRAALGLYLREETKIAEALDLVVAPLGFWALSRLGKLMLGTIDPPFGQYDLDVPEREVRNLRRRATQRPFCRVSIGWGRSWTVQDAGELAGAAIASDQGLFAVEEYRVAHYPPDGRDADVLEAWPTAEERPMIPTLYVNAADAEAAAAAAFTVYGQPWDVFDVDIGLRGLKTDLGRVQRLTHARYGLSRGKVFRLVAMTESSRGVSLTLWAIALPQLMVFDDEYVMAFDTDEWMQY